MGNFESVNGVLNITQIWEVFFVPIVSMLIIIIFTYFLLGKQYISRIYKRYKVIRIDNKYYRQKRIISSQKVKSKKNDHIILLPVSEMSEKILRTMQTPLMIGVLFLVLSYAVYKLTGLCSYLFPIRYGYTGSYMLLYSAPKEIIAEIWTHFPKYTLESLYQKINIMGEECSYAKYADDNIIYMFRSTLEMCFIICIINLFLQKRKIKNYLKTLLLLSVCLGGILISFYFQFQKDVKVLEQKVYYVEGQLALTNPSLDDNFDEYQKSVKKVEDEMRYIEDKTFYNSFIINIGKYSISF